MKISQKLEKELNDQIQAEFASAYLYLSMSAWFDRQSLPGFAHWMRLQASEEADHGMRIYRHVLDRQGSVVLQAIEAPPASFDSPLEAFREALEHEKSISERFHHLYRLATDEEEYASIPLLEWFVTEQVEEEDSVRTIVDQLELVGDAGHALLLLDRELAARAPGQE